MHSFIFSCQKFFFGYFDFEINRNDSNEAEWKIKILKNKKGFGK